MNIVENINIIKNSIPSKVTLVVVSKMQSKSNILTAYNAGHRIFGENKVQEIQKKYKELMLNLKV